MGMEVERSPEQAHLRNWLERADANRLKCMICRWIADTNRGTAEALRPFHLGGVELSPQAQWDHLLRCVGRKELVPPVPGRELP